MLRYLEGKQEAVDWAVSYLSTPGGQKPLARGPIFAEWLIAEAKTLHGLRRAFFRGLEKVSIQALLTATVQNIKRLLKYCRDRINPTITKGYITEKVESLLQFFKLSSPDAVQTRYVFFLKTWAS